MSALEASNLVVCAALAAPHLLYAFIWFRPLQWHAWFGKNGCRVFEGLAWLLKGERAIDRGHQAWREGRGDDRACQSPAVAVFQALAVAYWWLLRRPSGIDFGAVPPTAWAAAALLGGIGQVRPGLDLLSRGLGCTQCIQCCIWGDA